jgi:hypothetical protein
VRGTRSHEADSVPRRDKNAGRMPAVQELRGFSELLEVE